MLKKNSESSTTPEPEAPVSPEPLSYDEWEELSDDNGERIEFKPGMEKTGFFVQRATIQLPIEQQQNGQETADLIVFGDKKEENRWNMWDNYTTKRVTFIQGDEYKVACTGERKTSQGNMKVYSIKHKVTKVEEPF